MDKELLPSKSKQYEPRSRPKNTASDVAAVQGQAISPADIELAKAG
ncbi:hypothetical protein O9992_14190 [Vibrio lentus]|nr:hypothetical protein [Vibrio lentus]